MQEHPISGPTRDKALDALRRTPLFGSLAPSDLELVLTHCKWVEFAPAETIVKEGEPADSFFLLIHGEAEIVVAHATAADQVVVGRLFPVNVFGEMALLLNHPRTATVVAQEQTFVLQFTKKAFDMMMDGIKGYARHLCASMATRLAKTSRQVPLPQMTREEMGTLDPQTVRLLPAQFMIRHRVLAIDIDAGVLKLGVVDDPTPAVINAVRRMLPSVQIRSYRISTEVFEECMRSFGFSEGGLSYDSALPQASGASNDSVVLGVAVPESPSAVIELEPEEVRVRLSKIEPLLQRMVAEGASDLHLSAGQKPRWRIDGDLYVIEDCRPLGKNEVEDMLAGIMSVKDRKEFYEDFQCDFAYSMAGVGRFRANLFYDDRGSSAVLRHIPSNIPSMQQLQLPPAMRKMIEMNQGLILVTGPTGSGKSTTLAAIIEEINQKHPKHIITLEDPIEFLYESKKCLINQRQIGSQCKTFDLGLRSALREDPDIILVGELRDRETMMLALETANTGHLVLGTLHTRGTISTIERIIDLFPADLQGQVRASLSDLLLGVISQVLCKRKGGGRIAAYEFMSISSAAANLIRQAKTHQLTTVLTTQKPNTPLNVHLEELVRRNVIEPTEAYARAVDKEDIKQRLGVSASAVRPSFGNEPSISSSNLPAAGIPAPASDGPPTGLAKLHAARQSNPPPTQTKAKTGGMPRFSSAKKKK